MSAKYAVLGLVIERPGYGYQLAQRLQERFGSSGFVPSGVYAALDQLSREGLVRASAAIGGAPVRGPARRVTYRATMAGVEHFAAWMLGASPAPPLREELHMKIALARPRDVPRLIDAVYGQELACAARLEELEHVSRGESASGAASWTALTRALARDAEIALWGSRIAWLQSARELLEELLERSESAPPEGAPVARAGRTSRLRAL